MQSFFFYFIFYLDIVLVLLVSIKFNHPAWVFLHWTHGPSLLWTDFIMCQVNLVNHYLFSAVSYVQLLLCMSFISNYCLVRLFKWKILGESYKRHLFISMGRVCNGPRCPGTTCMYILIHRVAKLLLLKESDPLSSFGSWTTKNDRAVKSFWQIRLLKLCKQVKKSSHLPSNRKQAD